MHAGSTQKVIVATGGAVPLRDENDRARRRFWIGPLAMAAVIGCTVSTAVSGRLSVRLIIDGALSFAFVPAFQIVALFVVCRFGRRVQQPFSQTVDRFFATSTPVLVWLTAMAALFALVPPRDSVLWLRLALFSGVVPLLWCGYAAFLFFRREMGRTASGALIDIALHRLLAWSATLSYFFGIAVWHEYVPQLCAWLGS